MEAVNLVWPSSFAELHEVGELHQAPAVRQTQGDVFKCFLRRAVAWSCAEPDIIEVVILTEISDDLAADERAQSVRDVLDLQAELARFLTVDLDAQFGFAIAHHRVHIDKARLGAKLREEVISILSELREVRSDKVELKVRIAPPTRADSREQLHTATHIRILGEDLARHSHGLELRPLAGLAQVGVPEAAEFGQLAVKVRDRDIPLPFAQASGCVANGGQGPDDDRLPLNAQGFELGLDLANDLRTALQVRALGDLHGDLELTRIILRHEGELGHLAKLHGGSKAKA